MQVQKQENVDATHVVALKIKVEQLPPPSSAVVDDDGDEAMHDMKQQSNGDAHVKEEEEKKENNNNNNNNNNNEPPSESEDEVAQTQRKAKRRMCVMDSDDEEGGEEEVKAQQAQGEEVKAQSSIIEKKDDGCSSSDDGAPRGRLKKRSAALASLSSSENEGSDNEEERERRARKKAKKVAKKAAKRAKKEAKKARKKERAQKVLGEGGEEEEDDDDEMSSAGADMVDDDDAPMLGEGASHSGDSEPSQGESLSDNEQGLKVKNPKEAAAPPEATIVDWPQDEGAEFSAYAMPISFDAENKMMFCAILFHTALCDVEQLRCNIIMHAEVPSVELFDTAWRANICDPSRNSEDQHAHPCNSYGGKLWDDVGYQCEGTKNFGKTLQCARRESGSRITPRNIKTLPSRRWIYCTVVGDDVRHMRCAVGAYRLRLKFYTSYVKGISGGDFAMAAVDSTKQPLDGERLVPMTMFEMRDLSSRSLCLINTFEIALHEFRDNDITKFVKRKSASDRTSSVLSTCYAGFPIVGCCAGHFELLGTALGNDLAFCEPLPMPFSRSMKIPRQRSKTHAVEQRVKNVVSSTMYNVGYARTLMLAHCFDQSFFVKAQPNVSMPDTPQNQNAKCVEKWAQSESIQYLSTPGNSGSVYVSRVETSIRRAFEAASGGSSSVSLSYGLVNRAMRKYQELYEALEAEEGRDKASGFITGNSNGVNRRKLAKDRAILASLRRFLRWFSDAHMGEHTRYTLGVRALGLGLINELRDTSPNDFSIVVNKYLSDSLVPYVALFDDALDEVRHVVRRTLHTIFVEWMRVERPECWETLRKKLDGVESDDYMKGMLCEIFNNIINSLGPLRAARQGGERCIPIYQKKKRFSSSLFEPSSEHYERIINVELSPVRVVRAPDNNCLLVDILDYEIERALRTIVLNEAHIMQAYDGRWREEGKEVATSGLPPNEGLEMQPVVKDDDSRIVLIRSDNADTLVSLLEDELYKDAIYDQPVLGSDKPPTLVAIAHGEKQLKVLQKLLFSLYNKEEDAENHRYFAYTMQDFLALGPVRVSLIEDPANAAQRWGSFATQLLIYNTHRFAYDELTMVLACACGVSDYGPKDVLHKYSDAEVVRWKKIFLENNQTEALDSDFDEHDRKRVISYTHKVRELAENFGPKHQEDTEAHWRNGMRARWIFTGIAYQRPSLQSLVHAPCGNAFEDLYFSNVATDRRVRVREAYTGIAIQMQRFEEKKRLRFLPEEAMINPAARRQAIMDLQTDYVKHFHSSDHEKVKIEERRAAKEREKIDKRAQKSGTQSSLKKYPAFNAVKNSMHQSMRVSFSTWIDINTLVYTPNWVKNASDLSRVTHAPRNAVDAHTEYARANHKRFHCELLFIGSEVLINGSTTKGLLLDEPLPSHRAVLDRAPDICGCGRWFFLEELARLRTEESGCLIITDTRENAYRTLLVPNTDRKTCASWLYMAPHLRKDPLALADTSFFAENFELFKLKEIENRVEKSYASCLQSSSVLLWQEDDDEIIRQMNEEEEEEGEEEEDEKEDKCNERCVREDGILNPACEKCVNLLSPEKKVELDEEDDADNENL